ncbi:4'-phosphopantetheinyl transferase family protein [Nocardiopsis ansamitocini]|uniref:4'-phosphopantetheinyl transferase n=1 Tax=Nocardiopsis ansamitocini TaxID=1670832 RepID=A0A9W6UJV5_9ACTN|nr:4'-phosphopantetheinyl transferase superfamily protein [Nocardiopsis ansamitocini]GLU48903.1 4'-phosphopantetheinyl transferase [Nocardiopsis ansamitocini]
MLSSSASSPVPCAVWWAAPALATPALLDILDTDERARHGRLRQSSDRDRYAVAHALARLLCAQESGCDPREVTFALHCGYCTRTDPHGKPRPTGPSEGLEISITHSGERVGVALSRGVPVGLDVEAIKPTRDLDGLADYALTAAERATLDARPEAERAAGFFSYWSRKEALLKATGAGLSGGLTSVAVNGPHEDAAVLHWDPPNAPAAVCLTDLDAGAGYRAALAALAPGPLALTVHDGAALLASH